MIFVLQIISLISRFALTLLLAYTLTLSELGVFGLFSSLFYILTSVVGGGYAATFSKTISNNQDIAESNLFHSSLVLAITTFTFIIFPFLFIFSLYLDIASRFILYLFILVWLDSQIIENKRLLLASNFNTYAAFIDALRLSLWVILLFLYYYIFGGMQLDTVLSTWLIGSSFAYIFYLYTKPFKMSLNNTLPLIKILKQQYSKSLFFVLASMQYFIIESGGRFLLSISSFDLTGVYTFYSAFSFVIPVLVWSVTMGKKYSYIASQNGVVNYIFLREKILDLFISSIFYYLLFSCALAISLYSLFYLYDFGELEKYFNILPYFFIIPLLNIIDVHLGYLLHFCDIDRVNLYASFVSISSMLMIFFLFNSTVDIIYVLLICSFSYLLSSLFKIFYLKIFLR